MGLATIDPHSHRVQTTLYKIPKFGVKRPKSKQDTDTRYARYIQSYKEMYGHRTLFDSTSAPDAIHFVVNFEVF